MCLPHAARVTVKRDTRGSPLIQLVAAKIPGRVADWASSRNHDRISLQSKTADYMAGNTPTHVFGRKYSTQPPIENQDHDESCSGFMSSFIFILPQFGTAHNEFCF